MLWKLQMHIGKRERRWRLMPMRSYRRLTDEQPLHTATANTAGLFIMGP
jgi:hypothetical protein